MEMNKIEGKKVIIASFVSRLLKIMLRVTSCMCFCERVGDSGSFVIKYSVSSFTVSNFASPNVRFTL